MRKAVACVLLCVASQGAAWGDTPEAILATFEIHPEFQIELVAMEPQVFDPVDLEFDEFGRAFVVEMGGYPFPDGSGKVVMLEDADGDGTFETRHVFAEGFDAADSILPYRGGLLVASPPQLFFLKDTDGDDKADVRETWLDGFDLENTQHNFNGLTYGLDNWIYAASGGNSGEVFWPGKPDEKTALARNDFRMDFDNKRFELIGHSSGGFEMTMDDFGRLYTTHNTQHIFQFVFPGRYMDALPIGRRGTLAFISDHDEGGLARVYPIGEPETRVNHPDQSGFFSGACGITHYGGSAFGDGFNGNVFVCDVVTNLVHRDVLVADGAAFSATRGRAKADFLASTDRAFRPVNLTVGPDGALYVLDIHRTVIEHPEWIPDEIEEKMDINAGKEKGRIFRITPKAGLPRTKAAFDRKHLPSVIDQLGDANQWRRITAQRLLVEWKDETAVPLLRKAIQLDADNSLKRLHALWTLQGLGVLTAQDVALGLGDSHPGVVENALQMAELVEALDETVVQQTLALATHDNPRVRMQTALTLGVLRADGQVKDHTVNAALMAIAGQDMADSWTRWAVICAAKNDPHSLLALVLTDDPLLGHPATPELIQPLAQMAATTQPDQVVQLVSTLARPGGPPAGIIAGTLNGIAAGLPGESADHETLAADLDALMAMDTAIVEAAWRLANRIGMPQTPTQQALLAEARQRVTDTSLDTAARQDALSLLAFAPYADRLDMLFGLLDTRQPRGLQNAAMAQIREGADEAVALRLLDIWTTLGPDTRSMASDLLIHNRAFHGILLTALESGMLPLGQMNFNLERRRALLFWSTDEVKARAEKLFTDAGVVTRQAALDAMRPALELPGDPARGHAVYAENCMKCHQIADEGFNVGPNLTDIARKSKETLLHDILDPNAAADTQYLSYAIVANDESFGGGEIVTGIIVDESDTAVVLREAGGNERTFEKAKIEEMRATGLSLMPEELENTVSVQAMADLLAFLQMPR